jgi:hypothetical protein
MHKEKTELQEQERLLGFEMLVVMGSKGMSTQRGGEVSWEHCCLAHKTKHSGIFVETLGPIVTSLTPGPNPVRPCQH